MPRIVPIQLLKCLKVLLDDNGGILSAGEVKRLASLMTKYSKKLVSKCIYVQILKCTKTELLGEFMGAGGWSLVYTWLNDAIRAMNWPLVQEILELLLLCPVDVHRLKINSAPKLVKGLCKDGGNEGVRILAKRLVEQWLKVVTENPDATLPQTTNMPPQSVTVIKTPTVAVAAPEAISVNVQQTSSMVNSTNQTSSKQQQLSQQQQSQTIQKIQQKPVHDFEDEDEEEEVAKEDTQEDKDPLGDVQESLPETTKYSLTPAQKKASESGLVYKIIVKDGQSVLAKVPPKSSQPIVVAQPSAAAAADEEEEEEVATAEVEEEDAEEADVSVDRVDNTSMVNEADENSSSLDKNEKENDSNSGAEDETKVITKPEENKKTEDKKSTEDKDKSSSQKERRSSKEKERRVSSSGSLEKDKDNKSSKSSSSSSHRSSSHKSSSSSSKSSSSSSSKSKSTSSSSSSSYRSSSDKHKSDKDRSSSSKDKDRSSGSSSSSKHRSSSSKSSSSSSSSKDKYREKEKSSSSSSSSSKSKDKDANDKEKIISSSSTTPSIDKLGKIPKKPKEDSTAVDSEATTKHTSITIPSKKASMSIEIRKDTEKSKTVKTYKSQFRSHGLTEEAPPPPSRKGLKKPSSTTPSPGTILPSSLPSSLKRTSPPPRDSPTEKKLKIDINNVTVANEKPGAIKLIPAKKKKTNLLLGFCFCI